MRRTKRRALRMQLCALSTVLTASRSEIEVQPSHKDNVGKHSIQCRSVVVPQQRDILKSHSPGHPKMLKRLPRLPYQWLFDE